MYKRWKRKDATKAYDVLVFGTKMLLERGDVTAGTELATTLVRGYLDTKAECSMENLARIEEVIDAYFSTPGAGEKEGEEVLKAAVVSCENFVALSAKWLRSKERRKEASALYEKLGRYTFTYLGDKYASRALTHTMTGNNLTNLVSIMAAIVKRARPDEEDLIVAKVVLRFLNFRGQVAKQLSAYAKIGKVIVDIYEKETERKVPDTPLMHFLQLAIEAIEISSDGLLSGLKEKYGAALGQDVALSQEVDQMIAKLKPRKATGPPLSDMFKTLFSGAV